MRTLKTADFRILTRSLTRASATDSEQILAQIALNLRERVKLPTETRYRLIGVGLLALGRAEHGRAGQVGHVVTGDPEYPPG